MTERVPSDQIEDFVGAKRHPEMHLGRLDSKTGTVYIMHPQWCIDQFGELLPHCWFSHALDCGINLKEWEGYEDKPVILMAPALGGLFPEPYDPEP